MATQTREDTIFSAGTTELLNRLQSVYSKAVDLRQLNSQKYASLKSQMKIVENKIEEAYKEVQKLIQLKNRIN